MIFSKLIATSAMLAFVTLPLLSFSQADTSHCKDIRNGTFFMYPQYSQSRVIVTRTGDLQQEINTTDSVTSVWKVNWVSDCSYTLQYISGTNKDEAAQQAIFKKHKMLVNIYKVTSNYYVYKSYRDSISDIEQDQDTIWLKDNLAAPRKFTKKDLIEASFPGGAHAWTNYITDVITDHMKKLSRAGKTGTCYITFIVDTNGAISAIEALTMEGTELAKVSMDAIKNGPRWKPAYLNGKAVKAYRIQPIIFTF